MFGLFHTRLQKARKIHSSIVLFTLWKKDRTETKNWRESNQVLPTDGSGVEMSLHEQMRLTVCGGIGELKFQEEEVRRLNGIQSNVLQALTDLCRIYNTYLQDEPFLLAKMDQKS